MAQKQVQIQASHTYVNKFEQVAQGIQEAGMTIQNEILPLGHFQGLADEAIIERLKNVPGVALVSVTGDEGETQPDDYTISESDE